MSDRLEPGAYQVRYATGAAISVLGLFVLPGGFVALGLAIRPVSPIAVVLGLALAVALVLVFRPLFAGVLQRRSQLVIDSRGVLLGHDPSGRPTELVPWPQVDAVVTFTGKPRWQERRLRRYVGVVQGGRIVAHRQLFGVRLDRGRAAAAVARFGGGRAFREAPHQPVVREETLTLPPEWVHWAYRADPREVYPPAVPVPPRHPVAELVLDAVSGLILANFVVLAVRFTDLLPIGNGLHLLGVVVSAALYVAARAAYRNLRTPRQP